MASELASHWKTARLGEVADVNWGDTSVTKAAYVPAGFPAYSASGPDGFLPYADFDRVGIVVSAIGADCGKTWLAKGKWSCIKNTIRFWSTGPQVDSAFLYWRLRDPAVWPKRGSAQPFISQGDARALEFTYPPFPEQRAIAHILGTLDDKIELNRRMNETLEAIARALFKSWFVDFDPVRAKAEGRDPDLPAHLADLFPDSFEDSELGEIPKGWGAVKTGDLVELSRDALDPGDFPDERFDHFSIPAFDDQRRPKSETGAAIKSIKFSVQSEAVLVSKLNPRIPRIWMPTIDGSRRAICSTEFFVTLPRPGVTREYLHSLFSSRAFASVLETLVGGTSGSHQRVQPETFLSIEVALPPLRVMAEFTKTVGPMLARMSQTLAESEGLAVARDTLLPRLISGGVTVARSTGALRP